VGNHYTAQITFAKARDLLKASEAWTVTDKPEDNSMLAQFHTTGEGFHGFSLYHGDRGPEEENVKTENTPQPFVFCALELTLGVPFYDLSSRGPVLPWWYVAYGWTEDQYKAELKELADYFEVSPELPPLPVFDEDEELEEDSP
jgi:hypothetical protein